MAETSTNLSSLALDTPQARVALGTVAANLLTLAGQVTFFVNADDLVEIAPPGEVELDACEPVAALEKLLQRGYTDEQLQEYLRGREARLRNAQRAGRVQIGSKGATDGGVL